MIDKGAVYARGRFSCLISNARIKTNQITHYN